MGQLSSLGQGFHRGHPGPLGPPAAWAGGGRGPAREVPSPDSC